jgi:hypothetical protein
MKGITLKRAYQNTKHNILHTIKTHLLLLQRAVKHLKQKT